MTPFIYNFKTHYDSVYVLHILPHLHGKMEMTLNFKTVMTLGSKGKLKWKLYREGYSTISVIFPLKKKTQRTKW